MQFFAMSQECSPSRHPSLCALPVLLVLQQQNFKQKVVALLRRFKVSEEVSGSGLCVLPASSGSELPIHGVGTASACQPGWQL